MHEETAEGTRRSVRNCHRVMGCFENYSTTRAETGKRGLLVFAGQTLRPPIYIPVTFVRSIPTCEFVVLIGSAFLGVGWSGESRDCFDIRL